MTGHCEAPPEVRADMRHRHTLLVSCTDISQHNASSFAGLDCVNGSMLAHKASHRWDWSSVRSLLHSDKPRLDISGAPNTNTLRIFHKTRVSQIFSSMLTLSVRHTH